MASTPDAIPSPPPGTIWVAEIGPALNFLMIGATMGSALVCMLLALFFFSTPTMRRKPVFILNVLGLCLGVAGAITNIYEEFRTLLYPNIPLNPHVIIAMGAFDGLTPTLIDAILLLRLYAVYPYERTPRLKFFFILGVPIATKIGRIINAAIFLNSYARTIHASTGVGGAAILITSRLPSVKIEWTLQVFDDVFSSTIFLARVYRHSVFKESRTVSQAIKTLFWISASNFVFPVILGIAQLAIYLGRPEEYLTALYVEAVNFHFTIMGVVFATLWVAEGRWEDSHNFRSDHSSEPSTLRFNARVPGGGKSEAYPREPIIFSSPQDMDISLSTYADVYPPSRQSLASGGDDMEIKPEHELAERSFHEV